MRIIGVIHGTYDPDIRNGDGTYTFYTKTGGYLWYVKKVDIFPIGETEQALAKENEILRNEVLSLRDQMSSNEEKIGDIERALEVLRRYTPND